jgi:hypothetical protein
VKDERRLRLSLALERVRHERVSPGDRQRRAQLPHRGNQPVEASSDQDLNLSGPLPALPGAATAEAKFPGH